MYTEIFNFIYQTNSGEIMSFLGAIIGSIIGALVLIYVTKKDREENTELLIKLKRPYLDISFEVIGKEKILEHINKNFHHAIFSSKINELWKIKEIEDANHDICTAVIRNSGESCAMVNLNKTYIKINYKTEKNNYKEAKLKISIPQKIGLLNKEEWFIILVNEDFYRYGNIKILEYNIEFNDLTGKNYRCYKNDKQEIIDNEKL